MKQREYKDMTLHMCTSLYQWFLLAIVLLFTKSSLQITLYTTRPSSMQSSLVVPLTFIHFQVQQHTPQIRCSFVPVHAQAGSVACCTDGTTNEPVLPGCVLQYYIAHNIRLRIHWQSSLSFEQRKWQDVRVLQKEKNLKSQKTRFDDSTVLAGICLCFFAVFESTNGRSLIVMTVYTKFRIFKCRFRRSVKKVQK